MTHHATESVAKVMETFIFLLCRIWLCSCGIILEVRAGMRKELLNNITEDILDNQQLQKLCTAAYKFEVEEIVLCPLLLLLVMTLTHHN